MQYVYLYLLLCLLLLSSSTRTTARVIGTVLEDGVGAPSTHNCDAHQVCGGWKGESGDVCPVNIASSVVQSSTTAQAKCAQYWPEKVHGSITAGSQFTVTLSSSLPFVEYEIKKFKVQCVSTNSSILPLTMSRF